MKMFILVFTSLLLLSIYSPAAKAAYQDNPESTGYTYSVDTGDVGTIEVKAQDKSIAFRVAGNECFERRVAQYKKLRGEPSEDRLLDFIDSCANLKW